MDSLAALKAEISKKRQQESRATEAPSAGQRPAKRWKSRADIEEERRREYLAQEQEAAARRNRDRQKRNRDARTEPLQHSDYSTEQREQGSAAVGGSNSTREPGNLKNTPQLQKQIERTRDPPLSKAEVIKRLRSLKEPATLFGEDPWDRFNRMRDLELAREEVSKGQRNVFQKKMREMEAKDAEDDLYKYTGAKLPSLENKANAEKREEEENAEDAEAPACKEDYVYSQLRKYMRLWASEIDAMSKEQRRTKKGRSLAVTYEQTKDWLKPLHKLLRKRKLAKNILDALMSIFEATAKREYVLANSLYLERLAIGNAPWPMGATMVGIHARAAREKIGEDKIAHVMNDEQTRKYIQAVKRLLTVAQRHFPTSFSKMIM